RSVGAVMRYKYQAAIDEEERNYRQKEFIFLRDQVVATVIRELIALQRSGKVSGRLARVVDAKIDPLKVSEMQAKLQAAHEHMRLVDADLDKAITEELNSLKENNPATYATIQNFDTVLAAFELLTPMGV